MRKQPAYQDDIHPSVLIFVPIVQPLTRQEESPQQILTCPILVGGWHQGI
jgi:hypothetical protein